MPYVIIGCFTLLVALIAAFVPLPALIETGSTTSATKSDGSAWRFSHQPGFGILITMVVGGAFVPVIQGFLADKLGYQTSFAIVFCCYTYLVFFAFSGYKIRQPRFGFIPHYTPPIETI